MFNSAGPSLADIAAVTNNRDGDGWGDGNGWWVLIILFALFGGWGNGFGNNGNRDNGYPCNVATTSDVQRGFDNQAVISKLDGINNGICSLGYDQLAQMNGINQNIMQTGFGLQSAINGVGQQVSDCCCTTQRSIDQVRFDMAQNTCSTNNVITQGFAQLDRSINDQFCQLKMEQKDQQIAEQQNLINALNLAQSQANQNQYLVNQLRPCPTPAYITCNPWATNGTAYTGGNCVSGCGCGC